MPDLRKHTTSTAAQPRRITGAGSGRGRVIGLLLFALLLVFGGIEALVLGLVRQQDASRLAAAPVCAAGQQTGCRLDEQVTVADLTTEPAGRSGDVIRVVKVQTPDGRTQIVYAGEGDAGLWARLQVSETLKAELWNGNVIRLDDGAGHYLLAQDSPAVTAVLFPVIGVLAVGAGGLILALGVRRLGRQRPPRH